jgi:MYXO-CTERM domain-containing protein
MTDEAQTGGCGCRVAPVGDGKLAVAGVALLFGLVRRRRRRG